MGPIAREIETRLRKALAPESLQVMDDSEKHRGHAGHDARGESHFTVKITSAAFEGRSRVERQRMVSTEERRVGKEGGSTGRSRWSPYQSKKKQWYAHKHNLTQ